MLFISPVGNPKRNRRTRAGKDIFMSKTDNTPTNESETEQPGFEKRIGNTLYQVNVHFSETSKETLTDKILRLIRNEKLV